MTAHHFQSCENVGGHRPPLQCGDASHGIFCTKSLVAKFVLLLFLSCALPAFAEYRTVEVESLRITIDSDWASVGAPGYFPVRFDITNLAEAREIEIVITDDHYFDPFRHPGKGMRFGAETGRGTIRQAVRLKRGDRVKLTMPLPVFADNGTFQIRIEEGGRPMNGFASYVTFQSGKKIDEAPVLLALNPSSPLGTRASGWLRPMVMTRGMYPGAYVGMTPGPGASLPPMDFLLDPERLPSNWLAFTSLRAVLLGPTEWDHLNAAQKDALLTWTASGGDLLFVDGPLDAILPPSSISSVNAAGDSARPYFLGHIHLLGSADITTRGFKAVIDKLDGGPLMGWGLPANRIWDWEVMGERGFKVPIDGVGGVPSRAYLTILVLFLVLIGPVNYIYLWRKRLQVLLVLTVPLISACFIVLLVGYGVLTEGFEIRSRAATFTVLDQVAKHAATRSSVSLYTGGVAPSVGVRFAPDTAVFPIGTDGSGPRATLSLDLTGAQTFQAGLLQSRTPGNFEEIRYVPARERLNFEHSGSELHIVNGLGSTIQHLLYRESGQNYALSGQLAAGEKATLKVDGPQGPGRKALLADMAKSSAIGTTKFRMLIDAQPEGSYMAVLEKSPFWESGMSQAVEQDSLHLVLGYVGEPSPGLRPPSPEGRGR
jgi:hypothetical protein